MEERIGSMCTERGIATGGAADNVYVKEPVNIEHRSIVHSSMSSCTPMFEIVQTCDIFFFDTRQQPGLYHTIITIKTE